MKTLIPLTDKINSIMNEEKRNAVTTILDHYSVIKPHFDRFSEACELWTLPLYELNLILEELINDTYAEVCRLANPEE